MMSTLEVYEKVFLFAIFFIFHVLFWVLPRNNVLSYIGLFSYLILGMILADYMRLSADEDNKRGM